MSFCKKLMPFILIISLFLSGCWDRKELNEIGLSIGVAIDPAERDNILLTVETVVPSNIKTTGQTGGGGGGGAKGKPYTTFSAVGETIFHAVRRILDYTSRKIFYGYNQIIIINEDIAREYRLNQVLDFFFRDPELRERNWVLVTPDKAADILNTVHPLEMLPAKAIADEIKANTFKSKTISNDLLHVHQMIQSKGGDVAVPVVRKDKKNQPFITGSAVFKDEKFAGYLTEIESRGVLWVLGKVRSGIVVFPWVKDDPKNKISIEIIKVSSKIIPYFRDGKPGINVKIQQIGNIGETGVQLDLEKPGTMEKIADLEEKAIKQEVEAALKAAKKYHADVFGFGNHVHIHFPKEWKAMEDRWRDEIFPELPVNIEVKCKINQVGLSLK